MFSLLEPTSLRVPVLGSDHLGFPNFDDELGALPMAQQIASDLCPSPQMALRREMRQPSVIGVFGRWGVGKTHLLNLLGQQLAARNHIVCCFPAWQYEMEGDLAASLFHVMADPAHYPYNKDLSPNKTPFFNPSKVKELAVQLTTAAIQLAHPAFSQAAVTLSKAIADEIDTNAKASAAKIELNKFRSKMQELVDNLTDKNNGVRVFVLVDDLDRCAPQNAVRLFEWFKNHLHVTGCTFILGLDHTMAARAVVGHFRDYVDGSNDYGFHYLHKLIERDYEIQPSPLAQQMAMKRLGLKGKTLSGWTKTILRRDFAGEGEMLDFLNSPALYVPRMMLRSIDTYRSALTALIDGSGGENRLVITDLVPSFPYWLCAFSVLHCLLPPDKVEIFVRNLGKGPTAVAFLGEFGPLDPRNELVELLGRTMASLAPPNAHQATYLYRLVREKTARQR